MSHSLTGRPVMQKEPRYENRKLLDLCHGAPCHLNYPGCTGGTHPDYPGMPCHENWLESGRGINYKTHDDRAVPGCPQCHWQHDKGTAYTTEQKKEVHDIAHRRWWRRLLATGRIQIKVAA